MTWAGSSPVDRGADSDKVVCDFEMLRPQNKVPWVKSKPKQIHHDPPPVKDQCSPFSWHGTQGRSAGPRARRKLLPVGSHVPGTLVVKLVKHQKQDAVVVVVVVGGVVIFVVVVIVVVNVVVAGGGGVVVVGGSVVVALANVAE